ncbi:MAG: hypothetical protein LAP87_07655 [Acidobacteriia bacterium]|nr:hypothetical protein [Terriglobia bacterium]
MRGTSWRLLLTAALFLAACSRTPPEAAKAELASLKGCDELLRSGFRPIATSRNRRFNGKVQPFTALCRGGDGALQFRATPWVDWGNYWGAGDARSRAPEFVKQAGHLAPPSAASTALSSISNINASS